MTASRRGQAGARRNLLVAVAGLFWLAAGATGAGAATCAKSEVSGRGEPASYRWLALVKARGNWRSKVRVLPELGAPYANFRNAAEPVERCISNSGSIVCTVTAIPCRP